MPFSLDQLRLPVLVDMQQQLLLLQCEYPDGSNGRITADEGVALRESGLLAKYTKCGDGKSTCNLNARELLRADPNNKSFNSHALNLFIRLMDHIPLLKDCNQSKVCRYVRSALTSYSLSCHAQCSCDESRVFI